jgi:PhnB protein
MANRVKPIPEGHRTVAPYLAIKNAVGALEFYKRTFGAIETYKLVVPDGRVGHAEIRPGECRSAIGARVEPHINT